MTQPEPFAYLWPTVWKDDRDKRGYWICEMRSWDYSGPQDHADKGRYELEIRATRHDHPRVRRWMVANGARGSWARILGTASQGFTGAAKLPTGLLLMFRTPGERSAFQAYWRDVPPADPADPMNVMWRKHCEAVGGNVAPDAVIPRTRGDLVRHYRDLLAGENTGGRGRARDRQYPGTGYPGGLGRGGRGGGRGGVRARGGG